MSQAVESRLEPERRATVLLVDEDPEYLELVRRLIQMCGYVVQTCNSYLEGVRQMESGAFDIVFVGQGSRSFEGRCVLECATAFDRRLPVVVVARSVEMSCYLEAMQLGAVDYISPGPLGPEIAAALRTHARPRKSPARIDADCSSAAPLSSGLLA